MMIRRATAAWCLGALALVSCSSDSGRPVGGGPEKYEEPPDFQQHEGKDWKIISPTRTALMPVTGDPDFTVPVHFVFSERFVRYECDMDLGLQWLRLDGTASLRRSGIISDMAIAGNDVTVTVPVWPSGDDRAKVAGTTSSVSVEVRFVCPAQGLDFQSSHTFRATFPSLG